MLHIVTIVLDGMPWITGHLQIFNSLKIPWKWHISEGLASHAGSSWNLPDTYAPGLSKDGTSEYIDYLSGHPNIDIVRKEFWGSKTEMINSSSEQWKPGDVVMQVDSDEFWTADKMARVVSVLSSTSSYSAMLFRCRFFLGKDIVIISRTGYANDVNAEWRRAWRVTNGFKFIYHNPPRSNGPEAYMRCDQTEMLGLTFDHYAYATKKQVAFKEIYYGYTGAVEQWTRLQENKVWPIDVSEFLHWIPSPCIATKINEQQRA